MKKINVFLKLLELKRRFIEKLNPSAMKEHDGKCFTRKRSLTMGRLLAIILRCCPDTLQIRLDDFFKEIRHKEENVSKQAFSKARTNLDPDIVKESFRMTARTLCECEDLEYYKKRYRLCAVDGSDITLDNAAELLEYFGGSGKNKDCAMAEASLCYDPLNNIILDGGLYKYGTSEREAFKIHFDAVVALPKPKGIDHLYINDRGYPSREILADMIDSGRYFLMRVRRKFHKDFDLVEKKEKVTFSHDGKEYTVRVFNITLDSGEKEILVTNVPKKDLKYKEAAELYFKRWAIETKFNSLKNKLELENMSGRRVVTTFQDFWAKLDLANTMAALEYATDAGIADNTADSGNKHEQTTNENRLISKFSDRYVEILATDDQSQRVALFDELVAEIVRRPVEVKPERSFERKPPRDKKFCDRYKKVLH
jgi:hypothetical protein